MTRRAFALDSWSFRRNMVKWVGQILPSRSIPVDFALTETVGSTFTLQCSAAGCFSELTIQFAISRPIEPIRSMEIDCSSLAALFGRTLLQNIREYFAVYWQTIKWYCCCCCCCGCAGECLCRCKKGESMPTAAKEDSRLEDFDSMVLLQEYLEISKTLFLHLYALHDRLIFHSASIRSGRTLFSGFPVSDRSSSILAVSFHRVGNA